MKEKQKRQAWSPILALLGVLLALLAGCGGGGGGDNGNSATTGTTSSTGTTSTGTTSTGGQTQTATITGVLKDSNSGIPLRNLLVTVQGTTLQATSGSVGNFTITNVPLSTVTLVVTDKCNHSVGQQAVNVVTATQTTAGRDVGTLSFNYLSSGSGAPPPSPCL